MRVENFRSPDLEPRKIGNFGHGSIRVYSFLRNAEATGECAVRPIGKWG